MNRSTDDTASRSDLPPSQGGASGAARGRELVRVESKPPLPSASRPMLTPTSLAAYVVDAPRVGSTASLDDQNAMEALERELARAYRIERALREVGLALGAVHDRDQVLRIIVDRTIEALEAERATLYLLEDVAPGAPGGNGATKRLVSKVIEGGEVTRIVLELGQGIAGDVARSGCVANVRDAYLDPRFSRSWDERSGFRTRAVLCVPLRNQSDETVGVLQVLNRRPGSVFDPASKPKMPAPVGRDGDDRATLAALAERDVEPVADHGYFDDDDEVLLGALASQASVRIEQAAMMQQLRESNEALMGARESLERKVQDLHLLFALERASAHTGSRQELAAAILPEVARAAGGRTAYVVLADEIGDLQLFHLGYASIATLATFDSFPPPSRGARVSSPALTHPPPNLARMRIKAGDGLAGAAIESTQAICVDDLSADPRRSARIEGVLFPLGADVRVPCVVVPLLDEIDRAFGALCVVRGPGDHPFEPDDVELLQLVALNVSNGFQLQAARSAHAVQERLSTIGSLLSGVMHDLKTPMMVISGNVQLMSTTDDPNARVQAAEAIQRQFEHIAAMQKEVLEFARGERTLFVRRVYLAKFFGEIEVQLRREIERRQVPLALEMLLHDRGTARFDESKLTRAVHNLARNAIEAMGTTPGRLTITVSRQPAAEHGHDRDVAADTLVIAVTDSGPGLLAEVQERLFQSFVSAGKPSGTGLGLAIVKKIAEDHGGTIEASSSARGATFTLKIPQRAEPTRRPPPLG